MNVSLPPLPAGLVVQVLLMICSTACSAQNATVAFTVLALVTMLPVFVALFAKQLFVETWNLHQVSLVPLRQGSVLVVFSFCSMFSPPHSLWRLKMLSPSQQERWNQDDGWCKVTAAESTQQSAPKTKISWPALWPGPLWNGFPC